MIEEIDKLASGCTKIPPHNIKTWTINILTLVDDKRHYINLIIQIIQESLTRATGK